MGNPTTYIARIALFDDARKSKFVEALGESLKKLCREDIWDWTKFRINIANLMIGGKEWCSEKLIEDIAVQRASIKEPCLSIEITSKDDAKPLDYIMMSMTTIIKPEPNPHLYISAAFAKAWKCCVEEISQTMDSTTSRWVSMFDGEYALDETFEYNEEDPALPFLDVVYQYWEEAIMHLTLNGEVQDEEQQS